MSFTAQDVKALREVSGAGMMDCKKALEATDGDLEAAKQYLREKGLAASAKREDRDASQGVVSLVVDGKYRATASSAGGHRQLMELTNYLVEKSASERQ